MPDIDLILRGRAIPRLTILSLIAALSLLFSSISQAAIIEGVIFARQGPVPGSSVVAYPDYPSLVAADKGVKSIAGEKPGQYHLELKPGKYFFVAQGELTGQKVYAYHGLNPVTVSDDYSWLPFFVTPSSELKCGTGPQGIQGRVTYKGEPLAGGVVSVYQQDTSFRGMGLLTNTLEDDGLFWFDLEPGPYVVIARKRMEGRGIGPVQKGDLYCYPATNPITVQPDTSCEIFISCYPRDNLEDFLDDGAINPQGRRLPERRPASLWDIPAQEAEAMPPQSATSSKLSVISGRVIDLAGKPVDNLFVSAYPADGMEIFQMHIVRLKTKYMARTDSDGNYSIDLDRSGKFYLVAREKVGEAPNRLEYYGLYEGNSNHSVTIDRGDSRKDIDIKVERIMPYSSLAKKFY